MFGVVAEATVAGCGIFEDCVCDIEKFFVEGDGDEYGVEVRVAGVVEEGRCAGGGAGREAGDVGAVSANEAAVVHYEPAVGGSEYGVCFYGDT